MSLAKSDIYRFDEFQLDPASRVLSRDGAQVPLYPKAFEVLIFLAANPGRVVTKEEIFKAVWPESFVEEGNLARQISSLRRALGDRSGCIVTIPGRGYQFAAKVEGALLADPSTAASTEETADEILVQRVRERTQVVIEESLPGMVQPAATPAAKRPGSWANLHGGALAATLAAIFALAGTWMTWTHLRDRARAGASARDAEAGPTGTLNAHRRSIAVLGFRNLSGNPSDAWLSTALVEMLSTELVAGEKLRLVSGEDIARTKLELPLADVDSLSRGTLSQLHKNLDSDLVVLGSYTSLRQKADNRIRLDLRLQDTASGETVADVAVMGGEADLFDLVSQAGSELREKLGVEGISPVEAASVRASLPAGRDAARLYSEGLARLRVFDALGSRTLLGKAIAADPKFAPAHSAMAEAWSRLGYDKKAQAEARQAYDLSANLSREEKLLVEGRYRDIGHENEKAVQADRTLFLLFPDNVEYGLKLATAQIHDGRANDALETVKSMRRLAAPASDDPRIDMQESAVGDALSDYGEQEQALSRAAEKARANGSRLILAQARQGQCWVFGHTGPVERAVDACREAASIFAAAGDRQGEGNSFRAWADALRETDASESVRLYQRALGIFQTNGSERGVAGVYNNLGLIYEAQGELASAEKMHYRALAGFRLVDNKSFESAALSNIAGVRVDQGDLLSGTELYEESLALDREDPGRVANTSYNIASVRQLQGDLAGARRGSEESLAIWQKSGDRRSAAYAMEKSGDLMLLDADFAGARTMYEQALAVRRSSGNETEIAETQLDIARVSLESDPTSAPEAELRQVLDVFQRQKMRDDEIQAWCLLSRALLAEGQAGTAHEAMQRARSLAAKSQSPKTRWAAAIDNANVDAAQRDAVPSAAGTAMRKELAEIIGKSHKLGYRLTELDARLALAELEMKAGQTTEGRAHLTAIETEAKAIGYNLVAHQAAVARG